MHVFVARFTEATPHVRLTCVAQKRPSNKRMLD